ncbi:MAG: hypothetical protein U5O39_01350 [Gammaproteobacteria bacterium]|nr:hypothetical protein [Gammaproteobacteria bacterium]
MRKLLYLSLILVTGLLAAAVWHSITLQKRVAELEHDAYPLVNIMSDYLRFADKLYLAGEAGNWELANWYAWKLTKATWPVTEGEVVEYRSVEDYDVASADGSNARSGHRSPERGDCCGRQGIVPRASRSLARRLQRLPSRDPARFCPRCRAEPIFLSRTILCIVRQALMTPCGFSASCSGE